MRIHLQSLFRRELENLACLKLTYPHMHSLCWPDHSGEDNSLLGSQWLPQYSKQWFFSRKIFSAPPNWHQFLLVLPSLVLFPKRIGYSEFKYQLVFMKIGCHCKWIYQDMFPFLQIIHRASLKIVWRSTPLMTACASCTAVADVRKPLLYWTGITNVCCLSFKGRLELTFLFLTK